MTQYSQPYYYFPGFTAEMAMRQQTLPFIPLKQREGTKGLAFILTNDNDLNSNGIGRDRDLWFRAMNDINFDCVSQANLTKDEMLKFTESCSNKEMDGNCKFVVFMFSGHGYATGVDSQNDKEVEFQELLKPFFLGSLANKTRLFFIDACRRRDGEENPPLDINVPVNARGYAMFYPCQLGGTTPDSPEGSYFLQAVVESMRRRLSITEMAASVKESLDGYAPVGFDTGRHSFYDSYTADDDLQWAELLQRARACDVKPPLPPNQDSEDRLSEEIEAKEVVREVVTFYGEENFHGCLQTMSFTDPRVRLMMTQQIISQHLGKSLLQTKPDGKKCKLLAEAFSTDDTYTAAHLQNFAKFVKSNCLHGNVHPDKAEQIEGVCTEILHTIDGIRRDVTRRYANIKVTDVIKRYGKGKLQDQLLKIDLTTKAVRGMEKEGVFDQDVVKKLTNLPKASSDRSVWLGNFFCSGTATTLNLFKLSHFPMKGNDPSFGREIKDAIDFLREEARRQRQHRNRNFWRVLNCLQLKSPWFIVSVILFLLLCGIGYFCTF